MAVCGYCQSTLLKDADSVRDIGKMSQVLEDYSPIQITTSGVWRGLNFSVVGRIQLSYDAGFWNEWYVLFDDSSAGWLADASGQYVMTVARGKPADSLAFELLRPGMKIAQSGREFVAADVRTARCVAGQGELPFKVGPGWEAKVADFRAGEQFLTLDYSDGFPPQLFAGEAVTLDGLKAQLLRSLDQIKETAGKFKGKTRALDCPNCGSPIKYQAGMAEQAVCPSCHAEVDLAGDRAVVLKKHDELGKLITSLALGDTGTIDGVSYTIIGLMKRIEVDEPSSTPWLEYLLYAADKGFLWLVESNDGWDRVEVLNESPGSPQASSLRFRGEAWEKLYDYEADVIYAAGAFNWRVSIGERATISDFGAGNRKLTAEATASEISWSLSERVPKPLVGQWFGKPWGATRPAANALATEPSLMRKAAKIYTWLLALLNIPISFGSGTTGILILLFALLLIWLPVFLAKNATAPSAGGTST